MTLNNGETTAAEISEVSFLSSSVGLSLDSAGVTLSGVWAGHQGSRVASVTNNSSMVAANLTLERFYGSYGIYVDYSTLELTNSVGRSNVSSSSGSIVHGYQSDITISGGHFNDNLSNGSGGVIYLYGHSSTCLLYTSPSPRDQRGSRMPSSA